jgi:hypothetical protein
MLCGGAIIMHARLSTFSARRALHRRRMRYSVFRAAYVAFRTLSREAAAWHAAVTIAASLFCAVIIVKLDTRARVPYLAYFLPVAVAAIYGLVFTTVRYRRVWGQFPSLRREMRERRMAELRYGGYALRKFRTMTYLRVMLPVITLMLVGGIFIASLYPRERNWKEMVLVVLLVIVGMFLYALLAKWNEQFRPLNLDRLCPRCGYDLAGSPSRCPECGMRRMKVAVGGGIGDYEPDW